MESHNSTSAAPDPGLPPVAPPTARMFLRLFLVPALIVAGLVAALIVLPPAFNWFSRLLTGKNWSESRSAAQFLRSLDDANMDVRWQAASDLAQVLLRDDHLASDPEFALELASRLEKARTSSAAAEKDFAQRVAAAAPEQRDEVARRSKSLEGDRDYILYLGACLGNFMLPVGVPALDELAGQDRDMEPQALAQRRRQAVWALANLGENLKRFDKLSAEQQLAILEKLDGAEQGENASLARSTAEALRRRQQGKAGALGVDRVLIKCAEADDPALREMAAFAMNFWRGTATEDAAMEKALVQLSFDNGRGEADLSKALEKNPTATRTVIKRPGFRVQANATVALARRGSPGVRLDLLHQLLEPETLRQAFVVQEKESGREQPQEDLVASTLINALKAAAELHRLRPEMNLSGLRPLVDGLTADPNNNIQAQARLTQQALAN
jgi:hypothetical protein